MGKWFPIIYDFAMKPLEKGSFQGIREELINRAEGRVLELGSVTFLFIKMLKESMPLNRIP
ncbi:hypothetical protein ACFYKX_13820 [Cytobacillus sp. FJAT-54145]|uniref:Uncharacterized protein n=1 Tax=Cytobacillus spartinae TaxID=3299023 RepID=A0ABW6KDN9_9BACI